MLKYFTHTPLIISLAIIVFFSSNLIRVSLVQAQITTVSEFVDLLISIGVIVPEKALAARTAIASLNTTTPIPSSISTSTTYLQVLSPNGGENWNIDLDLPYSITWGSSDKISVNLDLIPTKGKACSLTSLPFTSKKGNNSFNILLKTAKCYNQTTGTSSPLTDGSYKVRVLYAGTDNLGTTIMDESNTAFKILPKPIPSININYPNGGETFIRNREYEFRYTLKNVTTSYDGLIYVYLLDSMGNIAYNTHKAMRNNKFDLDLPSSLAVGAYKVRLKLTTSGREKIEIEDTSNNFFWISSSL